MELPGPPAFKGQATGLAIRLARSNWSRAAVTHTSSRDWEALISVGVLIVRKLNGSI